MPPTVKLAEYLFTRLRQLDIGSVHGVPGDYNLTLLDYVEPAGLHWVGNANELNAGYAADGYARVKGIGAIVTTYGVGELSAINAIAGAYAERAAVVHIVGTPGRATQDSRLLVHHTLLDGEYRHFAQMAAHVTVAQASLTDPRTAPDEIDYTLKQCLLQSRPVYIEVPVDLVSAPVLAANLERPLSLPEAVPNPAFDVVLNQIIDTIYAAKQPIILVDGESRGFGIVDQVNDLVKSTNWPTWTNGFGKGLVDETLTNFHGVYQGRWEDPAAKQFFETSDLVLCFGPHFSTTNTYGGSSIPKRDRIISFTSTEIWLGSQTIRDVPAKFALSQLLNKIDLSKVKVYKPYPSLPRDYFVQFSETSSDKVITQDKFWRILANFIRPGDIVLGETGTSGYGCREMVLPKHARVFGPVTWLSIGYMLPAAQGTALAQKELVASSKYYGLDKARTVLFIGDGSFQMTVQSLSTMIRNNLDVIVFLINNDGYTIERCIHGLKQRYNDVARWRYLEAPSLFGASTDTYTASVRTWGELEKVLRDDALANGKGLRMVEVMMDAEDTPAGPLLDMIKAVREVELGNRQVINGEK